jgi:hypothetical protein
LFEEYDHVYQIDMYSPSGQWSRMVGELFIEDMLGRNCWFNMYRVWQELLPEEWELGYGRSCEFRRDIHGGMVYHGPNRGLDMSVYLRSNVNGS